MEHANHSSFFLRFPSSTARYSDLQGGSYSLNEASCRRFAPSYSPSGRPISDTRFPPPRLSPLASSPLRLSPLASRLLSSLIAHLRWSSLLLATCLDIYLRCHHSLIRDVAVKIQRTSIAQGDMRSGGNILRSALRSIATNKIYKISARSARSYILLTSRLSPYRL